MSNIPRAEAYQALPGIGSDGPHLHVDVDQRAAVPGQAVAEVEDRPLELAVAAAVAVGGDGVGELQGLDAAALERCELVGLGDAVLVAIAPQAQLAEAGVLGGEP